jgi:ubiquinone/menaquinone biosynthesis C-methylase UbiE
MLLKKMIGQQFRQPQGWLGRWVARTMIKRNWKHYIRVIELLEIQDADKILEIGFGPGLAILLITQQNLKCRIQGLDFSELMWKKARRNNRAAIQANRVDLQLGEFGCHDFGTKRFTKIFAINVIYFWNDLDRMFAKLFSLLEPKGRLVIYMSSPERLNLMPFAVEGVFNKHRLEDVQNKLKAAGFSNLECQTVIKDENETYYLRVEK